MLRSADCSVWAKTSIKPITLKTLSLIAYKYNLQRNKIRGGIASLHRLQKPLHIPSPIMVSKNIFPKTFSIALFIQQCVKSSRMKNVWLFLPSQITSNLTKAEDITITIKHDKHNNADKLIAYCYSCC